ncbi:MAG: glycosyltransferase [Micrococcales bacterium]|nr:glycosyltransferase [Micrococcales bacterium]
MSPPDVPRVVVLLATFDGMPYLPDQLRTVLDSEGVQVRVVASDDGSSDGTADWLAAQARTEPRLTLLPGAPAGSAAANFYRLLVDVETADDELVALADQDDLWYPDKLARCAAQIADGCAGVSSDVVAFRPDGRRSYIRKAFAQRPFDYVCESPGPGSTFLLDADLVARCRAQLADPDGPMRQMTYHDWAIYAVARGAGLRWRILDTPTLDYRQHDTNVMGARTGLRAYADRLRLVTSRWHRAQAALAAATAAEAAETWNQDCETIIALHQLERLLADTSFRARWALARRAGALRRRRTDQAALAAMVMGGMW